MDQSFTNQTPISFTLNRRTHHVSSWMELVHELLEDLFMGADKDGSRIMGIVIPGTDKKIVYRNDYSGKSIQLSNGLRLPSDYSEKEYAAACRIICIVYSITPCEMSIAYAEFSEISDASDESSPESIPAIEAEDTSEIVVKEDTGTESEMRNSFSEFEKNLQNDFQIESKRSSLGHMSETEEKWLKLMLNNEDTKPSSRIQITAYNDDHEITTEQTDWDDIIDHLKHDNQALAAAKLMKKAGIKPPIINFRGIKENNKVGGEALFVWIDEGIAYLHNLQKYSRGYFYERGFEYVIMDDPGEVLACFRTLEAENE